MAADALYDGPTETFTLAEVLDRENAERIADELLANTDVLAAALDDLTRSPLVTSLASRFVTRIVTDVVQTNRAMAEKIPGVGSLVSFGASAAGRVVGAADKRTRGGPGRHGRQGRGLRDAPAQQDRRGDPARPRHQGRGPGDLRPVRRPADPPPARLRRARGRAPRRRAGPGHRPRRRPDRAGARLDRRPGRRAAAHLRPRAGRHPRRGPRHRAGPAGRARRRARRSRRGRRARDRRAWSGWSASAWRRSGSLPEVRAILAD
ncbi:hypothetical protein [Nocardioides convexus]|uniref:hypothetical protein n=1 Tax=Nocardioides convexus TaxID=2712224 RepID=UPI00241872E4|nr:hypothetical protein [Nocardioides convexus]